MFCFDTAVGWVMKGIPPSETFKTCDTTAILNLVEEEVLLLHRFNGLFSRIT